MRKDRHQAGMPGITKTDLGISYIGPSVFNVIGACCCLFGVWE